MADLVELEGGKATLFLREYPECRVNASLCLQYTGVEMSQLPRVKKRAAGLYTESSFSPLLCAILHCSVFQTRNSNSVTRSP